MNVTDLRRERIPVLWSTVRETDRQTDRQTEQWPKISIVTQMGMWSNRVSADVNVPAAVLGDLRKTTIQVSNWILTPIQPDRTSKSRGLARVRPVGKITLMAQSLHWEKIAVLITRQMSSVLFPFSLVFSVFF